MSQAWILLDWNGTLVDDLQLCLEIHEQTRRQYQMEPLGLTQYLAHFGFPLLEFYQKVGFDLVHPSFETITQEFMSAYYADPSKHKLFQDVIPCLQKWTSLGYKLGIVSASKHSRLIGAVESLQISDYFEHIIGIQNDHAHSKEEELAQLLHTARIQPTSTYFVGDTTHDSDIALKLGLKPILISRGHQSHTRLAQVQGAQVFDSLESWCKTLPSL